MNRKSSKVSENRISKGAYIVCILCVIWNCIVYYGVRFLYDGRKFYDMTTGIEESIPVIPWTVIIYYFFFPFVVINVFFIVTKGRNQIYEYAVAEIMAKAVCLACFLIIPTTNVRPVLESNDIFTKILEYLYTSDPANNLFPSIHCMDSWLLFLTIKGSDWASKRMKIVTGIIASAICISTLTTKQHVLPDVYVGIALAEGGYYAGKKIVSCYSKKREYK